MFKKCYICQQNINTNLIIEYNKSTYNHINNNITDNFMVFFRNKNIYTCTICTHKYLSFINLKNKTKNILNSKIIGKYNITHNNNYINTHNNNYINTHNNNYDHCFLCNKKTKYKIDTTIYNRHNYIECIGQLCNTCHL